MSKEVIFSLWFFLSSLALSLIRSKKLTNLTFNIKSIHVIIPSKIVTFKDFPIESWWTDTGIFKRFSVEIRSSLEIEVYLDKT